MRLVEAGELSLDDPLVSYIPWLTLNDTDATSVDPAAPDEPPIRTVMGSAVLWTTRFFGSGNLITNPLAPDYMSLIVGHTIPAAEEIASCPPGVYVVKAFNTLFVDVLNTNTAGEVVPVTVFVAGMITTPKRSSSLLRQQLVSQP